MSRKRGFGVAASHVFQIAGPRPCLNQSNAKWGTLPSQCARSAAIWPFVSSRHQATAPGTFTVAQKCCKYYVLVGLDPQEEWNKHRWKGEP